LYDIQNLPLAPSPARSVVEKDVGVGNLDDRGEKMLLITVGENSE